MQKFKPQYKRLMFIDRKIKERAYPNCTSLAGDWSVSAKTIQRDIDYLRDDLEAPIAYDALKHGFYYTEPNYSLPAINISESDLFSIYVCQNILNQYRNTPLFHKLASVFEKVKASLPEKTSVNPSWLTERILVFPEPTTAVNADIWEVIAKAIRENRSCRHSPTLGCQARQTGCRSPCSYETESADTSENDGNVVEKNRGPCPSFLRN